MSILLKNKFVLFSLTLIVVLSACLKGDFDTPPINSDPEISSEKIVSLVQVLDMFKSDEFVKLDLDKYLKVIVVADDKSGNFYRTLVVEDENSDLGISLVINENEIHAQYPTGRRIYVYLKDLYISDYNGLPQLGYGTELDNSNRLRMSGIPAALMAKVLIKGQFNLPVEPTPTKIALLGTAKLNTLVQLDDVEFKSVNSSTTYADNNPANPQSINHILVDCNGDEITLRNSGFADFAGDFVPLKNGSIVGVYSIFGSTKQLMIRNPSDLNFNLERCAERGAKDRVSIRSLRDKHLSGSNSIADGSFIQGVVISDVIGNNWDSRNVVIQDGNAGIVCRFTTAPNIPLGKEVKVILTGRAMSQFNGLLQVDGIATGNIIVVGDGTVTPLELQIKDIKNETHESTLVKIKDAEFIDGATYGVNGVKLRDATGTIQVFTRNAASFASTAVKSGKVNVTAVVGKFNANNQLQLRGTYDVE